MIMVTKCLRRGLLPAWAALSGLGVTACGKAPPDPGSDIPAVVWAATNVQGGHDVAGVVVGDWNGDGKPDLATLNGGTHNAVSVLLNQGDALFSAPQVYATGLYPNSIVTDDFDEDGRPDLAVGDGSNIGILLNQGDGDLAPISVSPVGGSFYQSLVSLDVNRDGRPDLVLASPFQQSLVAMINQGHGVFSRATPFNIGVAPYALAVGDLDEDGAADLMVGSELGISVWLNHGGPVVPTVAYVSSVKEVRALTVADLDGDGRQDVIAAGYFGWGQVEVWHNAGHGTLTSVGLIEVPFEPFGLAVGDMDGNGRTDVLVGGGELTLALNQPDGSFAMTTYDTGAGPMAVADLNADGKLDLALANWGSIRLMLNQPPWAQPGGER